MKFFCAAFTCLLFLSAPCLSQANTVEGATKELANKISTVMKAQEVKTIAVIPFTDLSGYPSVLGEFLAEDLITELFSVDPGRFTVVERAQLHKVLGEHKLTASGLFEEDTIARVGSMLGIEAIITGSIADLGTQLKLNARLISVETARVFAAASSIIGKDESVQTLLRQNAGPSAPLTAEGGASGPQPQASDVFFQNRFLRATVAFAGRNSRTLTVSLTLENLTAEDLLIAIVRCELQAVDNYGNDFGEADRVSGVVCIRSGDPTKPESYTTISAKSRTTLVARFSYHYSLDSKTAGPLVSLAANMVYLKDGKFTKFSMGLPNIKITAQPD